MQNILEKHSIDNVTSKESLKFTRLICVKCNNIVSKDFTPREKIILKKEKKGLYLSKLIYFKSIFLENKLNYEKKIQVLYQNVKCVQCNSIIGKFVKSATDFSWDSLDSILFKTKNLRLENYESEKNSTVENHLINIKNSELIDKLNDKDKLLKIFSTTMNETHNKLSELDNVLGVVLNGYQSQLEMINQLKVVLFEKWVEVRETGDKDEEISDKGLLDLMSEIKEQAVSAKPTINVNSNSDLNKENNLKSDSNSAENKFDCSEAPNSNSYKKDKSFIGKPHNYNDIKINNVFLNLKPNESESLKRKSESPCNELPINNQQKKKKQMTFSKKI